MKVIECLTTLCGETHLAGIPCALIRFSGCELRCKWCDTTYAYEGGEESTPDALVDWVSRTGLKLVLLTGGEPLLQPELPYLACKLAHDHHVLVETSGAHDIRELTEPIYRSVDIKCPGSGESSRNLWSNLEQLRPGDSVKMVLTSRTDYDYARQVIDQYELGEPVNILLSSAYPYLRIEQLAAWILKDRLSNVRLNPQLHRLLWPDIERSGSRENQTT